MDIGIAWDTRAMRGDWRVGIADLWHGLDVETAVLLSLFTDRVAPPDYRPLPGEPADRRGWWGDSYAEEPIGSWLWRLNRSVISDVATIPAQARDYCRQALQWLVDDHVVSTIDIQTGWISRAMLGIIITVRKPGGPPETFRYQWAWEQVS